MSEGPTMSDVDYDAAIAVIGMAGRFPGANSVEELWDNLLAGRPGLRRLDDNELMAAGVSPAQLADPDYVRTTGSISDHDMFDAGMFGFNRREAEVMDPQHRIFLETTFAALENAGYPAMGMTDRVGLFAGCGFPDYMWNVAFETISEAGGALMMAIGNERDSLASLASYKLNLRGPSITVQTFCSTSLIAVHLAAQSLLNFECETALAGGVFIPLPQGVGYAYEEGGILSPDGTARAFDAAARGSVMGSGASVVVLKRLADAIADGDHITAVILGSATNNDGSACAGYTAPGVDGQAAVIADAISFAGIKPETISYVECHGTGTVLGDSIEVAAMARVFPDRTDDPVVLGSLKASIGHLDRAAGSSSMIRAMLALRHRILPATPNYQTPNPALATARNTFTVLTENRPWPAGPNPRRAGVSAFGLGGSNAHVVLEEPPTRPAQVERPGPHILVVSGRDQAAADQAVEDLLRHLDRHPEQVIADVAFTLQQSRSYFPVRRAVVCADATDARHALGDQRRWLSGEARQRNPHVELIMSDVETIDPQWWASVEESARLILGDAPVDPSPVDPSPAGATVVIAGALRRLGIRIGRVSGSDAVPAKVCAAIGICGDKPCQAELVITPDPDGSPATQWLARAVARLWQAGAEVNWAALHSGSPRRVPLPTYPFQRRRYWVDGVAGLISPPASVVRGRIDDIDRWTYVPTWRSHPARIADHREQIRAAGPWLVLAAEERGEEVAAQLRHTGVDVVVARPGPGFSATGDGDFVIRPGCGDDTVRMLASVGRLPVAIVHAFGLGAGDGRALGYSSALALTSAYSNLAPDLDLNLVAVTEGAVSVAGEAPSHPDQAALAGLLPVLAQENPGWACRHVDVGPPEPGRAGATSAAAIIAEALQSHQGPVALRGRSRWSRSFVHLPLPSPADGALPPGSVVLITGGLGHVGLILARHLAVNRGCRVLLTSRTPLPPRVEWDEYVNGSARNVRHVKALLELERLGGEVVAVAADTTDVEQVRAAVALADERFGGLDLVVHAAGISDRSGFGPAHLIGEAGSEQHFAAKVTGFNVLRQVLDDRDVRGITLSSLSAVLGGLALGPYSAANAALDAHVLASRVSTGLRWTTVDWDTWGQGSGPDLPPPGEFDMAPTEAVEVFERAVAAIDSVDHIVISTGDLDPRFQQWVIDRGFGGDLVDDEDVERDPRPDLSTPYVEPAAGTQAGLAAIWARVLRLESVGADDDFFGLGGNSVLAIEVVGRIRKGLKVPVPTSAVMGFPTVRGLAGQIDELMETPGEGAGAGMRP
jgi:acyl transferase domain-containing protein/acyl carrier protein